MYKEGLQRTQDTQNRGFFNDGPPKNKITKIRCGTAYMRFERGPMPVFQKDYNGGKSRV